MNETDFRVAFGKLADTPGHFPWQWELYKRFVAGDFPASCNLPTGLGKTAVIHIWLLALATDAKQLPRRLVYVVNRRTVVDQSTDEAVKMRDRLRESPELAGVAGRLRELYVPTDKDEVPLAISTLRGQFADNREWSADPSRPAVICGTVDMIGSRLLFSGYGCGFKMRPLHAGFLGQDALIVHDEAHLEPAFQELLLAIEKEQREGRTPDRFPLKVMELTATSRADGEKPFELTDADRAEPEVQKRINATKKLHPHPLEKKLADDIVGYAESLTEGERSKDKAVLIFVRQVKDVEDIVKKLPKGHTQQLTGTLRGLERDRMADPRKADACPIFARFLKPPKEDAPESEQWKVKPKPGTVYLVCTSAGEVGVNISADHLVCDLSTFESMAQRFGRVNRFGLRDDTEIHVVHPKEFDEEKLPEPQMRKTLELLKQLKGDGSPAALSKLDSKVRQEAFAPTPTILPTSDILFDAWALTTIRDKLPGRPAVEPYLHGIAEWQPPETHVAWREEVGRITGDLLAEYPPKDLLEDYPLKPHELLRDNSKRVFDRLEKLKAAAETPVWLVADDDSVSVTTLGELRDAGKEEIERLTVLLPPSAGGLDANGMMDATSTTANDVADEWFADAAKTQPRRIRAWGNDDDFDEKTEGMRWICTIAFKPPEDDEDAEGRSWHWYEQPQGGDSEGSKSNKLPVTWEVHTKDVVTNTTGIVSKLSLGDLRNLFVIAARFHDLGKRRNLFQTILGNRDYPNTMLAKSGKKGGRIAETYRHEFGSLIDTESQDDFKKLSPDEQGFVLHLIAAHHGRGRPHFPVDATKKPPVNEVFDPDNAQHEERVARDVPRRFAQLQRKYGRWGLAYLESLLRAADYAASANPSEFMKEKRQ